MNILNFDQTKKRDVVVLGRATIDLYSNGYLPIEEATTFTKYVGGSAANTAVALANMGLDIGYIGKTSKDQFGVFIINYLQKKGIDISHLLYDSTGARSGVTIGEIKSPTECSFFMYREKVADLNIQCNEIDEDYIKQFKAILISGTSLSHSPAREAVFLAIEYAKRNNVRILFDPDYRAQTWKNDNETATYYRLAAEQADLVIGTREEFDYLEKLTLPNNTDNEISAKSLLSKGVKMVIAKKGKDGSTIYCHHSAPVTGRTFKANVVKTFGAGDAYAGAFIYGLIKHKGIEKSSCYAAAAAAITISGHSCSDSTPTLQEVETYINQNSQN